ncbi:MAG: c-type cytochrome [Alphaproteobacteria bacterium]|nr:c-type cytochrome [Alphaproteobacteria bacterium]
MKRILIFAALLAVASGAVLAAQASGDVAKGRQVYVEKGCAYCHGTVGQGGGGRLGGLRLANMGIALPAFTEQLRHPRDEMPPYVESVLPDREVADIFAYIGSLPPPQPASSIPILNR